jgi:hypothetical protein
MNDNSKFRKFLKWFHDNSFDELIMVLIILGVFTFIAVLLIFGAIWFVIGGDSNIDDHRAFVENCLAQEYYTRAECINIANAKVFGDD